MTQPFPVIVGPTAGGKSALAVAVAREFARRGRPAEIVSADSVQIFRGLDIGSAKPTADERAGLPHHLIDIVDPEDRFTVFDWLSAADRAIEQIKARDAVPVVVGGTNLYMKALLEGLFEGPEPDAALRQELLALSQAQRRAELERADPAAAARIHPNDERRTVRALEVFRQTGTPISAHQKQWDHPGQLRPGARLLGLDWPTDAINRRINARVRAMIDLGLVEEVRQLAPRLGPQSREALGYNQILHHFSGGYSLDDAIEQIKIETRRFAKNQRTWLRRLKATPGSGWFCPDAEPLEKIARTMVDCCVE